MPEWKTIASAPKDGSRVLLWNERWQAPSTGQYYGHIPGWGLVYEMPFTRQPTYWCELPAPPGEIKKGEYRVCPVHNEPYLHGCHKCEAP